MSSPRKHFVFISSNRKWGGSEELWSATAASLAAEGHRVTAYKAGLDRDEPRVRRLREAGAHLHDLARLPLPESVHSFLVRLSYAALHAQQLVRLRMLLALSRTPDLVVISQGQNFDGVHIAGICRRMKLPYALVMQKAADLYWPADQQLDGLRAIYSEALACYFVSEHNRRLTEEQLGMELPHASVVRNPFLVPWERRPDYLNDWPDESNGLRLACVGRIYPMEKGQDILLRVLAREKWRNRPLSVSFLGEGLNRVAMEQMARHLGLTSVTFGGFVADVASIWATHHALVLPSRCEGLPLVLVEAMLSGRVPIVTDVAGNGEVVDDDVTGFLASAPTEDALDEAMERAWIRRAEWRAIGEKAADAIRTLVPPDPAAAFAATLKELCRQPNPRAASQPSPAPGRTPESAC